MGGGGVHLPGAGYIFSGEVDVGCVGPMFVIMIVFCWFLDLFFSTIEEKAEDSPANTSMVRKLYKEFMILGFIQFGFILLKDFGAIYPTKSKTHCFDFSLLLVTVTVFLYVSNMAVSSFGMHVSKRSWDRMAMKSTHDVIRELKQNLPPDDPTLVQRVCSWCNDFLKISLGVGSHWRTEADFKVVELLFKTKFYLDRTFDYNRYLSFVLEDVVVNLSELSPYHWLVVMGLSYMAEESLSEVEVQAENLRMKQEELALLTTQQLGMVDGSSTADENSGIRRRLGAAAANEPDSGCDLSSDTVGYTMECGMDRAAILNKTAELFTTADVNITDIESLLADGYSLNLTNTTSTYEYFCRKCEIEQELRKQDPLREQQIQMYILGGWLLLFIEIALLHFLRHRQNRIYHYHGARRPSNMPVLLSKLDKHFERNDRRHKTRIDGRLVAEETVTVHTDHDEDSDSDDDDGAPLIARTPNPSRVPTSGDGIDPNTTPESTRNLNAFLDSDITNSPTEKKKKEMRKKARKTDDDGGGQTKRKGVEMEMMHFSHAGKDADDVLSYRLYVFLCSITKLVMLICCLYVSFYQLHYKLRVNESLMRINNYGQAEGWAWGGSWGGSANPCYDVPDCFIDAHLYHASALIPAFLLIFSVLPKVSRRISLLVGVLHLHEDALQVTVSHMETIENVRNRILERLECTTVVKGKAKLQKGQQMLERLRTGEVVLLHKLASIDEEQHQKNIEISHSRTDEHTERWSGVDWGTPSEDQLEAVRKIQRCYRWRLQNRFLKKHRHREGSARQLAQTRVTRQQAMQLLDQQDTQTETDELVKFLSRETFAEYQEKSPATQETALSAKSLRLSATDPDEDTILVSEFGTFLVRAIADVVNIAGECGVSWEDIKVFEDEVISSGVATKLEFIAARRMARSKALFHNMSHGGDTVSYKQLWKGLKRYRVPISKSEIKVLCPVIDPDQTRSITLEEWLNFALASDASLVQQVLKSSEMARKFNAMKGSQEGGLVGMAIDVTQYSREAIAAVPLGALMLNTIEHPLESGKRAVQGVQELAEMEANDALAVVAGIDKQRKRIVHEFQPMVEGAFVDVASIGLHAVEAGMQAGVGAVTGVVEVVNTGVEGAARVVEQVTDGVANVVDGAIEEVEHGVDAIRGSPNGGRKSPRSFQNNATRPTDEV